MRIKEEKKLGSIEVEQEWESFLVTIWKPLAELFTSIYFLVFLIESYKARADRIERELDTSPKRRS